MVLIFSVINVFFQQCPYQMLYFRRCTSSFARRHISRCSIKMMPEGPEVRSLVDEIDLEFGGFSKIKNDNIPVWKLTDMKILSGRYMKETPDKYDEITKLLPLALQEINCKGKFIYFKLENSISLWSTLGLQGRWRVSRSSLERDQRVKSCSGGKSGNSELIPKPITGSTGVNPSPYLRLEWLFHCFESNETKILCYYDKIQYGTLKISLSDVELQSKLKTLGPCWLSDPISSEEFYNLIKKTKPSRPLAVFLMDQSKTSGIGNYILSDVLYQSKIHPWAVCGDITEEMSRSLHESIADIVATSYKLQSIKYELNNEQRGTLRTKLPSRLDEHKLKVYMQDKCPEGHAVLREMGSHKRSIHWVPQVQILGKPSNYSPLHSQLQLSADLIE